MRGQKRDARERARAVGIAVATGNVEEAARQTGVPRPTIIGWLKSPEMDELRQKTPDVVREEFWAAVQIGLDQVALGLMTDAPLRDKAIALGVLYDKHALMSGGATARSETRDLNGSLDDHELATLKAIVQGGHPAEHPAEAPVADGSRQNGTTPS